MILNNKQEKTLTIVNEKGQRYKVHTNVMTNESGHYIGMIIRYEELEINNDNIIRMKIPMTLDNPYEEIITKNDQLIRELNKAKKASKSNATIIINGESEVIDLSSGFSWKYYKVEVEFEGELDIEIRPVGTLSGYSAMKFAGLTLN